MSSRTKITLVITTTMAAIALTFAFALMVARRQDTRQDGARYTRGLADLTVRTLQQERTVRGRPGAAVTYAPNGTPLLSAQTMARLETLPGIVAVFSDTTVMYLSEQARLYYRTPPWPKLQDDMLHAPIDSAAGLQFLGRELIVTARSVMLGGVQDRDTTPEPVRVVAGAFVPARPGDEVLGSLFVASLFIAMAAWAVSSMLGGTFERVERIRREVAAITDGRSLHRRVSADGAGTELSGLVEAVNAMIARLENSFMALRRFTADASHELKTPLAVLRADVERAMHDKTTTTERMVALEEALHETTRMADLVDSLLTLARADEGRFQLYQEAVDLEALTQEVYETALILGEAANVTVSLAFTAPVTIQGDRQRLRQLFLNLVTNAIKYTPSGGRVDLGLGRHPTTVTFAVRDTGIGIAAADLPHIFERFWRADRVRTRTAERGGVGLGLAISQWIAQAHHGTLTVSSRLGRGSLFTVTLPLDGVPQPHSALES